MKIITVIGARPQFIKAAVVSRAFREIDRDITEKIVHTGQHFDANMSDIFFKELEIPEPTHHLGIGGGTHGSNTGKMIEAVEAVLMKEKPDCLLVYGDTDSTLAGALAAVKLHIPVAHVEAGLRSFNRRMPEEINRILTDHASTLLFAPTQTALTNLQTEGITDSRVHLVGDVMLDAAMYYEPMAVKKSRVLETLGLSTKKFVLATIHRAENADDAGRMKIILESFANFELPVVMPMHPRTKSRLAEFGIDLPRNVRAVAPVGYFDMIVLELNARIVATDSGGVQKEAFYYQTPCVTLREETEWTELVETGWNFLAPPLSVDHIRLGLEKAMGAKGSPIQPYGDGYAAQRIADVLESVVVS